MTLVNLNDYEKFKEDFIKTVMSEEFPYSQNESLIDRLRDCKGKLSTILKDYYNIDAVFTDSYPAGEVHMEPDDAILFVLKWA